MIAALLITLQATLNKEHSAWMFNTKEDNGHFTHLLSSEHCNILYSLKLTEADYKKIDGQSSTIKNMAEP